MPVAEFYFNTVLICYSCRRQAIALIRPYVSLVNDGRHILNLVFVSCSECATFPHVFNPRTSFWRGYVDVERYAKVIKDIDKDIGKTFNCTPHVLKERRFFSIARQRFKTMARIRDVNQLQIPANYGILSDKEGCNFFSRDAALHTRRVNPSIKIEASSTSSTPMTNWSIVEPPPPYKATSCPHKRFSEYLRLKELPRLPLLDTLALP